MKNLILLSGSERPSLHDALLHRVLTLSADVIDVEIGQCADKTAALKF